MKKMERVVLEVVLLCALWLVLMAGVFGNVTGLMHVAIVLCIS